MIKKILYFFGMYECCGCDACHWEVFDFGFFYWIKGWDDESPKWKFCWRKND